jgi:MFS family permease
MNKDRQHITLLATSISYVLVILDTSIVNVALANISSDLATDVGGLQWIVTAYVSVFASLVLSGGALGDVFGARKVYLTGLGLFMLASLVSGCAPSLPVLIAGRILQGVGASLLVPCALSLIRQCCARESDCIMGQLGRGCPGSWPPRWRAAARGIRLAQHFLRERADLSRWHMADAEDG